MDPAAEPQTLIYPAPSFRGDCEDRAEQGGDYTKPGKVYISRKAALLDLIPPTLHQACPFLWKLSKPQEALLFERAEADSLNFLERQVFFKSRIVNYGDEDVLSPVHWCAKYLAWLLIVIYAVGLSFYVCLFAVKAGRATSVQWMISFWVAFVEVRWCLTHTRTLGDFLLPLSTAPGARPKPCPSFGRC